MPVATNEKPSKGTQPSTARGHKTVGNERCHPRIGQRESAGYREAFDFYQKTFGGQISFIQTIGESPMASSMPPEAHGRVMHVTLHIGDQVLQGVGMLIDAFETPWIVNAGQATGS